MPRHAHKLTVLARGDTQADALAAAYRALTKLVFSARDIPATHAESASWATARFNHPPTPGAGALERNNVRKPH